MVLFKVTPKNDFVSQMPLVHVWGHVLDIMGSLFSFHSAVDRKGASK